MKQHKRNMDTNNTNTYEIVIKEDGFAYIYSGGKFIGKAKWKRLWGNSSNQPHLLLLPKDQGEMGSLPKS
jgi:hypothetical protein